MAKTKKKNKLVVLVAVIVLLIFFHWLGLLGWLQNGVVALLKPILKSAHSVSTEIKGDEYSKLSNNDLITLLKTKQIENDQLIADNAQLRYLQEENKVLRDYAGFFERTKYQHVVADVISRNTIDSNYLQNSNVIINRGTKDGIIVGLLAVNQSGMVIGKVTQVEGNIAEISLLNSQRCNLGVSLEDQAQTIGITEGETGLTVAINFIPQTQAIAVGDVIVTSGLENNIPRGMVVGHLSQVEKENNEIWQHAVIEPYINLDGLMLVSVILPQVGF
jgi:rod shape-determining protein MreC